VIFQDFMREEQQNCYAPLSQYLPLAMHHTIPCVLPLLPRVYYDSLCVLPAVFVILQKNNLFAAKGLCPRARSPVRGGSFRAGLLIEG
jgi:hypothetical protein